MGLFEAEPTRFEVGEHGLDATVLHGWGVQTQ